MSDAAGDVPQATTAPWRTRAAALAIDVLPGAVVVAATVMAALSAPAGGPWRWVALGVAGSAILATAVNRVLLPAITGWSLGRAFTGIEVVRAGEPATAAGAGRLLLREAAHLLDTAPLFAGWLWALRDKRGRTFADRLTGTEVRIAGTRRPPPDIRARTGAVFVAAATLAVLTATASYFGVFQREHASDVARDEIYRQGPKIVADMLSYDPQTLQDDFARAQSLATEKYREQLVPQQDAIRNSKPVPNDYRVTDIAVVEASAHRGTALLFLQGQRGDAAQSRLISATVRVTFAKSAGTWQVDDLRVVTRPAPEGQR